MSDALTPFESLLLANNVRLPSAWQTAWEEAEATLQAEALDALVYGWWEAEQDRKARAAAFEAAGGAL